MVDRTGETLWSEGSRREFRRTPANAQELRRKVLLARVMRESRMRDDDQARRARQHTIDGTGEILRIECCKALIEDDQ